MADPTSIVQRTEKVDVNRFEGIIKDTEALVIGGLLALNTNTGKVEFMDDAQYLVPIGVASNQAAGNNENLTGNTAGDYSVVAKAGIIISSVLVTGTSAITDVMKLVYATDGQTLTLTRPTTGLPIGFIRKWVSGTTCDVQLFSLESIRVLSQIGTKQTICLGRINSHSIEGTSALDVLSYEAPNGFTIDSFYAKAEGIDSGLVAGDQDFNLEIGGTNVTGGLLTLGFADANAVADLATKISSTAITANNVCKAGDIIQVEMVAGGTGFTADKAGAFALYIDVTPVISA